MLDLLLLHEMIAAMRWARARTQNGTVIRRNEKCTRGEREKMEKKKMVMCTENKVVRISHERNDDYRARSLANPKPALLLYFLCTFYKYIFAEPFSFLLLLMGRCRSSLTQWRIAARFGFCVSAALQVMRSVLFFCIIRCDTVHQWPLWLRIVSGLIHGNYYEMRLPSNCG